MQYQPTRKRDAQKIQQTGQNLSYLNQLRKNNQIQFVEKLTVKEFYLYHLTWSNYKNLTKVFWEYVSKFDFAVETYLYYLTYYQNRF